MIPQGIPGVFGTECAALLQQRHHSVDEVIEAARGQVGTRMKPSQASD